MKFFKLLLLISFLIFFFCAKDYVCPPGFFGNDRKFECVLMHGLGQNYDGPPTETSEVFTGVLELTSPFCHTVRFLHIDLNNRLWDSTISQKKFCRDAGADSGGLIRDTHLITYSQGTLIAAGAFLSNYCELDLKSSSWRSLTSPAEGSRLADVGSFVGGSNWYFEKFEDWHIYTPAIYGLTTTYKGRQTFADLKPIFGKYLSGAMCGSYFYLHDGAVELKSCKSIAPSESTWSNNPADPFFVGQVHHWDAPCLSGSGSIACEYIHEGLKQFYDKRTKQIFRKY